MEVLQLGPYPPPHGGVGNNIIAIHNFLIRKNHVSKVINISRYRKNKNEGVYYPKNWFELLCLLLQLRYDIIHLHIGGQLTSRLIGLCFICSIMPHSKSVITFHSGGYPHTKEGRSAAPNTLRGAIFRMFDTVICVNDELVELFIKFGVKREKIKLISPFSFQSELSSHPLPDPLKEFFKAHKPILLTVGLLEPEYDLTLQIDVLEPVLKDYPKAGLVIIGSGELDTELKSYKESKYYNDNILLCGDIPHSDTLLAIQRCDLFLRTTLYDGDSIAVREALHLGTKIIATDTAIRPEGITIIPPRDIDMLQKEIKGLLSKQSRDKKSIKPNEENLEYILELYVELINS